MDRGIGPCFLKDQSSYWPITDRGAVSLVDWSDGKKWLYQERLVTAVKEVLTSTRLDKREDVLIGRTKFRELEHKAIIGAHLALYRQVQESN